METCPLILGILIVLAFLRHRFYLFIIIGKLHTHPVSLNS